MKLILLRGPSGTGKSTIARHLAAKNGEQASFHETDKFFMEGEVYLFNQSMLSVAHAWNQRQVGGQMFALKPLVIVSNTFIKLWEMEAYFKLADDFDYETEIIRTPGPWNAEILFGRNKHNVPMEVIERQINTYQPHPNERDWTDMSIFK